MPDTTADSPDPSCSSLLPGSGIPESQPLGPDVFSFRARDARGRFAKGHSGNPGGRPRGIRNPRRRLPDLGARPLAPGALSALLDRKPHLLRPLAAQLPPPPLAGRDPAERLGIDVTSLRTAEDVQEALNTVLAGVSRGDIAPAEAGRIARRVRRRLREIRSLARLARRLCRKPVVPGRGTGAQAEAPAVSRIRLALSPARPQ